MLNAAKRLVNILEIMLEELAETNFINDEERYENNIETRLNDAVTKRVDNAHHELNPVLEELRQEIELHGVQLGEFLPHLGQKFGGVVGAIHQCFPDEHYVWFLRITDAENTEDLVGGDNYLKLIMQQNIRFHTMMLNQDHAGTFATLCSLLDLLLVRPLYREACEATLVTCMEIIAARTLSASLLDDYFATLKKFSELIFPQLTFQREEDLRELIQNGVQHFDLMNNAQLLDRHKDILLVMKPEPEYGE